MNNKLKQILFNECKPWRDWRIKCDWRKEFAPYFDKNFKLSDVQRTDMHKLWDRYAKIDDYYHAFYTQKTGIFHAEYLPDDIYYPIIDRFYNNPDLALWLDDKSLYESLLRDPDGEIKFPHTIAILSGGHWLDTDFRPLSYDKVADMVRLEGEVFVKKSFDSCGGKGVAYFNAIDNNREAFDNLIRQMGHNLVIQRKLVQSPILSAINPSSVNTIRLISLLKADGQVKIYSVVLRMGINGAVVDNASSGGITVGVRDDGRLKGGSLYGKR